MQAADRKNCETYQLLAWFRFLKSHKQPSWRGRMGPCVQWGHGPGGGPTSNDCLWACSLRTHKGFPFPCSGGDDEWWGLTPKALILKRDPRDPKWVSELSIKWQTCMSESALSALDWWACQFQYSKSISSYSRCVSSSSQISGWTGDESDKTREVCFLLVYSIPFYYETIWF